MRWGAVAGLVLAVALGPLGIADAGERLPGGKPGKTGNYLLTPQFENAGTVSEGLAAVKVDGKWGFVDKTGKMVIEPQFNPGQAQFNARFSDGLVAVNFSDASGLPMSAPGYGTLWGFADRSGAVVINPQFEGDYYQPPSFSEGLAAIGVGFKWGFINKQGEFVIAPTFEKVLWFSEGLAAVRVDESWGFIDKTGKMAIAPQFESVSAFAEGLAAATVAGKSGVIDKSGNFVVKPQYEWVGGFSEGLAEFAVKTESALAGEYQTKYGYLDREGRIVIQAQFPPATWSMNEFSEGLAIVRYEKMAPGKKSIYPYGKSGFINKAGQFVINPKFDDAGPFSQGLAAVMVKGKWGYIDKTGRMVIAAQFDWADGFRDGAARVQVGDKYGFIAR